MSYYLLMPPIDCEHDDGVTPFICDCAGGVRPVNAGSLVEAQIIAERANDLGNVLVNTEGVDVSTIPVGGA